MFSVTLRRSLASRHFLPQLSGPEQSEHLHRYRVEATVMGEHLDDCGFLVNADLIAASLDKTLDRFEGNILNDMPEFQNATPSMENIAKAVWTKLSADTAGTCIKRIRITIWEAEDLCASFEEEC